MGLKKQLHNTQREIIEMSEKQVLVEDLCCLIDNKRLDKGGNLMMIERSFLLAQHNKNIYIRMALPQMSTHSICFYGEISKLSLDCDQLSSDIGLI